ncbi:MAG: hypothetical protein J6Q73_04480 [Bacteroidaceae bacterium]|nr:hypothetical protein [Bacteroidaceae bacterium]
MELHEIQACKEATGCVEYKHFEIKARRYGYNNAAHSLFFAKDIESNVYYKEHIKQFGDAVIAPGESRYAPDEINGIARFIRGIIET